MGVLRANFQIGASTRVFVWINVQMQFFKAMLIARLKTSLQNRALVVIIIFNGPETLFMMNMLLSTKLFPVLGDKTKLPIKCSVYEE